MLALLEEHGMTVQADLVNLANPSIKDVDNMEGVRLHDHLYFMEHPLAPVPISSSQLPLGNITNYLAHDIANLKSWLTGGGGTTTCACQSGCSTNNCKCRSEQKHCSAACACYKMMCINKQ